VGFCSIANKYTSKCQLRLCTTQEAAEYEQFQAINQHFLLAFISVKQSTMPFLCLDQMPHPWPDQPTLPGSTHNGGPFYFSDYQCMVRVRVRVQV
jgi:hypothetical protein